jgi:tetratricopeptide (TPR) repeat protein
MKKKIDKVQADDWLEQAYPEVHYLLLALDGDESAFTWLASNSPGVGLVAQALSGHKQALASLKTGASADLSDLFDVIDNEDLTSWLKERRPDVHQFFEAIQGAPEAPTAYKRKKALARMAETLRVRHEDYLRQQRDGHPPIGGGAAADMGCLIGELHLRQGEYGKAVEAFTRAIESQPAADLYEGRARAYRGLAAEDERRAEALRR